MQDKLSRKIWFDIVLFGFIGQIAWNVENMYFNLFLFNSVGGSTKDIANMVSLSAITAVITTFIIGNLSDKLGKRKIFLCGGYVVWGLTVALFAVISRENVAKILGISDKATVVAITVTCVVFLDCVMTFFGSAANDAAFNAWVTDITNVKNRGRVEGVLGAFPLLAMIVVAGSFGIFVEIFGYPACFVGLGVFVSICGLIGLRTVSECEKGVTKQTVSYFEGLIEPFKPSVIKKNKRLYIALVSFGIYGISTNIFMPYLIVYLTNTLGLTITEYSILMGLVVIAAAIGCVLMGRLTDKIGRSKLMFVGSSVYAIFLIVLKFQTNIILLGIIAFIMLLGYALFLLILNATIRDYTPENDVGKFQGLRMIFSVMIPMVVGSNLGNMIIERGEQMYKNEYGEMMHLPTADIFLAAGIVAMISIIPLFFLYKDLAKREKEVKEKVLN